MTIALAAIVHLDDLLSGDVHTPNYRFVQISIKSEISTVYLRPCSVSAALRTRALLPRKSGEATVTMSMVAMGR